MHTLSDIKDLVRRDLKMKVRKVARLVGQIISMSEVIGSVSQHMTRSLSMDIVSARSWNSYVTFSPMSIRQ